MPVYENVDRGAFLATKTQSAQTHNREKGDDWFPASVRLSTV